MHCFAMPSFEDSRKNFVLPFLIFRKRNLKRSCHRDDLDMLMFFKDKCLNNLIFQYQININVTSPAIMTGNNNSLNQSDTLFSNKKEIINDNKIMKRYRCNIDNLLK